MTQSIENIELLPCPFCGADAEELYFTVNNNDLCRCSNHKCCLYQGYYPVKKWNTRAQSTKEQEYKGAAESSHIWNQRLQKYRTALEQIAEFDELGRKPHEYLEFAFRAKRIVKGVLE